MVDDVINQTVEPLTLRKLSEDLGGRVFEPDAKVTFHSKDYDEFNSEPVIYINGKKLTSQISEEILASEIDSSVRIFTPRFDKKAYIFSEPSQSYKVTAVNTKGERVTYQVHYKLDEKEVAAKEQGRTIFHIKDSTGETLTTSNQNEIMMRMQPIQLAVSSDGLLDLTSQISAYDLDKIKTLSIRWQCEHSNTYLTQSNGQQIKVPSDFPIHFKGQEVVHHGYARFTPDQLTQNGLQLDMKSLPEFKHLVTRGMLSIEVVDKLNNTTTLKGYIGKDGSMPIVVVR